MAFANTVSLSTDLNVDPFYDDFNESKNFHRILFRPGYAVQGRELTQMQTILQNQIDRFGENIFQEGSTVLGLEQNLDLDYSFVKIRDNAANGSSIDVSNFSNQELTGQTSGIKAIVINTVDGAESDAPDTKTLYLKYTSSSSNNTGKVFVDGEKINANNGFSANALSSNSTGTGSALIVGEGVIFAKDHFIKSTEQTLILGKYSANVSVKIGFDLQESIVSSADDETLFDPARGSFNFNAPGANRLKIEPVLSKVDLNTATSNNFITILTMRNGVVRSRNERPLYAKIRDYIARRTFDESGNYIVNGLSIRLREHLKNANNLGVFTQSEGGNTSLLSADVESGKAYVKGYDYENLITRHLPIEKGLDSEVIEQQSIPCGYGNFVEVREVAGDWDIDGQVIVSLRDTLNNAITNKTHAEGAIQGTEIGKARVRAIEYVSGTKGSPNAKYRIYLYDLNMTGGPFTNVRSITYNSGSLVSRADIVPSIGGDSVLQDSDFNRSVFPIPASNIKTIRNENGNIDTTFHFYKSFDITIATDGTFSLTTNQTDEQFPFTTGLLNDTQKADNFYVTLTGSSNTANMSGTVSISSGANTLTGSSTNFNTDVNVGDILKITATGESFTVSEIVSATKVNTLQNAALTATSDNYFKQFIGGQVIPMDGFGSESAERTINISSTTQANFDIKEKPNTSMGATIITKLNKIDGKEALKVLRPDRFVQIDISSSNTSGPWNLGFSDVHKIKEVRRKTNNTFTSATEGKVVTDSFKLNTGQKDNYYDHGSLVLKPGAAITVGSSDYFLVKLDYFGHDTSQGVGYFSVDSYPVDDRNIANNQAITTSEIPIYTSKSDGSAYNLRDSIDIRPRIADTASDATTVGGASINPTTNNTLVNPGNGLHYAVVNEGYTLDLEYYLGRIDIVILDRNGDYRTVTGTPGLYPKTPDQPEGSLTLARLNIAPFPSLPSSLAQKFRRPEYANEVTPIRQVRYRMQDIGALEERIATLEYYTSLSLLERDTKDQRITDANGNDRFKNGFIVDNFTGHNVGNVNNPDYDIAIDKEAGEARPPFEPLNHDLRYVSGKSNNVQRSGELITLPYNEETVVEQLTATTTRNTAGLQYNWVGDLSLDPSVDNWVDTTERPDVQVNFNNNADNWEALANAWGTQWNDWQTNWTGRREVDRNRETQTRTTGNRRVTSFNTEITQEVTRRQSRTGVRANATPTTQTESLGNRIVESNIIPFMRSRLIRFEAIGMKPDTEVFPFFDDTDVAQYCRPADSNYNATGVEGDSIVTDSNGRVFGLFRLPNNDSERFRVGNKIFRLSDSPTNADNESITTSAQTQYSARGLAQVSEETVLSSRSADLSFDQTTQNRTTTDTTTIDGPSGTRVQTINPPHADPVAQSFQIGPSAISQDIVGVYLTSVDVYFATKDDTQPVTCEIREMDASTTYVTNRVVPFGKVKVEANNINTSSDSSAATNFKFRTPVFLQTGTDYAFVIKPGGGNPNVSVFVSKLGETDIQTGERISKAPFAGILFASSNDSTWTDIQSEDMKFKLNIASFTTNSGTLHVNNGDREYFSLANVFSGFTKMGEDIEGETTLKFQSTTTANTGQYVSGVSSNANGLVTFVNAGNDEVRLRYVNTTPKFANNENVTFNFANGTPTGVTEAINNITTPKGVVDYYDNNITANTKLQLINSTGNFIANTYIQSQDDGKEARIVSIDNVRADVIQPFKAKIVPLGTSTSMTGKFASDSNTLQTSFRKLADNVNNITRSPRFILSRTNENNNVSGEHSAQFKVDLKSNQLPYLSPAIDLGKLSNITIENLINNDATGEDSVAGGNAIVRYITRRVTLAEGQDAEDLKVFVNAYNPPSASIKVYYKIIHREDSDTFDDDIPWTEMDRETTNDYVSDGEDVEDLKEIQYRVKDANLTGQNDIIQYTNSNGITFDGFKRFAIKIVLLSNNPSNPPRIADFRAIAIQK